MDTWGWDDPHGAIWARDNGGGSFDNGIGMGNEFGGSANSDFALQANDTSRSALIHQFRFQTAKSIRTSTIILASFNVLAAFATAVGIIWDSYATKKRNDPKFKLRYVEWSSGRAWGHSANGITGHPASASSLRQTHSPSSCHLASPCKESSSPAPSRPDWAECSLWAVPLPHSSCCQVCDG